MQESDAIHKEFQDLVSIIPMFNGQTVKEQAGISEDDMMNLHALACNFFDRGKLNEAEAYFKQLVLLDSSNLDYLLGLGAVLQRKKLYSYAVDAYAAAHMMRPDDSRPMFYAGQCNFFERKYSKAKFAFELVVEQNKSPELVKMAKLFIEAIEKGNKDKQEQSDD